MFLIVTTFLFICFIIVYLFSSSRQTVSKTDKTNFDSLPKGEASCDLPEIHTILEEVIKEAESHSIKNSIEIICRTTISCATASDYNEIYDWLDKTKIPRKALPDFDNINVSLGSYGRFVIQKTINSIGHYEELSIKRRGVYVGYSKECYSVIFP